ncbi:NAD-dependent epimerase/dehydratase family protein [Nakamurella antarctica]|uniref:NAD-dependent epimerase/dehydratase family protein n=1 Tax=Nakamurella antarctica TaxID=1902245 RepID=A0A3G8ZNY0_9ACTN|nr:NAD-dependent epimerase/dehydratase family protein [Nakamurella antarctica]AZI58507.1 NAD-dependent epimerase/dehydratase family protein [Nakamurella antarctica]
MKATYSVIDWVIGAGGLLGGALVKELRARSLGTVLTSSIPWENPRHAHAALTAGITTMLIAAADGPWRVSWCAGAGVTGTAAGALHAEVATFSRFLDTLHTQARLPWLGKVFLASSAGGVYSGAGVAPFTETDLGDPVSPYGVAKLACEKLATNFALVSGVPVVIGRIANLYGPGQDLAKPQGLISHLCRAHVTGQPISVYVSLDTLRDYLFVDDCAALIADSLDRLDDAAPGSATIKILASGHGVTIGALLGECRRIFKRAPRVVLGTSESAKFQVKDLRLRSVVWPDLDRRTLTPLPVGIGATVADMLLRRQHGS